MKVKLKYLCLQISMAFEKWFEMPKESNVATYRCVCSHNDMLKELRDLAVKKYLKKLILIHKYLNKLNFVREKWSFHYPKIPLFEKFCLSISSDKGGSTLITRDFS